MNFYFAGVPGGGTSGNCGRERVKFILEKKTMVILLGNQIQWKNDKK